MSAGGAGVGRTVGSLCAVDLGATVSIRDGGAIYEATLAEVQHQSSPYNDEGRYTWMRLRRDDWTNYKRWLSDTPCEVTR